MDISIKSIILIIILTGAANAANIYNVPPGDFPIVCNSDGTWTVQGQGRVNPNNGQCPVAHVPEVPIPGALLLFGSALGLFAIRKKGLWRNR